MTTATPSPAAAKKQVELIRLLSEQFDPDKGRYAQGWDDNKVAATVGLSIQAVVSFRDAGFGPLKNPELDSLTQEIHDLKAKVNEDLTAIRSMLDAVTKEADDKIAALSTRFARAMLKAA
jgi:hypothetical protein